MSATPDWSVGRSTRQCAASGVVIAEGAVYYAVLREDGERFVRADYAAEAWPAVDRTTLHSWWKTKLAPADPDRKKRRLVVDVEAFLRFFSGLEGSDAPHRQRLRYVLGLILARKRALRMDGVEHAADGDRLLLYDRRVEKTLAVPVPALTPEEIRETEEELSRLFDGDAGPDGGDSPE